MGIFSSLRARLLALVLVAFVPALGLVLYTGREERRVVALEVREDALRLAKVAAATHESLLAAVDQLLAGLVRLPVVQRRDARKCHVLFADLVKRYPQYANLGVAAPDGTVFCSAVPFSASTSVRDRAYFRLAVETRDFAVGESQIGRITGKASINFGSPILAEDGQIRGVVFAALDLSWLNSLATQMQLPPGSVVSLVNRNGTVLAHYPDPEHWIGKSTPDAPIIRTVLAQPEGTVEGPGLDGVPRLYGFATIRRPAGSLYIRVGIPSEVAFAGVSRMLVRNLVGLGIVVAVMLGAAWIFSRAVILRPVDALVGAARRLATGDLTARAEWVGGRGELADLARAFDRMAEALGTHLEKLARAEGRLRRVNRALRVLSAGNRALTRHPEEAELLRTVCGVAVEVGGYRMAWVGFAERGEAKRVRPVAWAGAEDGYLESITVSWGGTEHGQGPVGTAIRAGTPQIVQHVLTDPSFAPWRVEAARRGYGSVIALPLIADEQPLGALAICAAEPDAFDAEEVPLLTELAGDLAYGIASIRTRVARAQAEGEVRRQQEALLQSEKLAALGRLAAGVAHELKNPLAVIQGRTKLLQMDMAAGKLPADPLSRNLESLAEAGERMRRIMEGLSAYSKPSRPEHTLLHLDQLLAAVRELVSYQAKRGDVTVTVDAPPDLPSVRGDRSQVMQILLNLATNGIEAMAEAGGQLTLRARARDAEEPAGPAVVIEVADTGPGIPPQALEKIWEAFYTTKPEGTGLGLSIVHGLVSEQPGATIDVHSRPGRGATFILTMPAVSDRPHG